MAAVGDVLVKFVADFGEFTTGLAAGQKKLEDFGEKLVGFQEKLKHVAEAAGAVWVFDKIVEFGRHLEETAEKITTMSHVLGVTGEQLQAYEVAAAHAGIQQDQLTSAMSRFQIVVGQAQAGGKQQIEAFDALGVKILDINKNVRPTPELMQEVAQKLLAIQDRRSARRSRCSCLARRARTSTR